MATNPGKVCTSCGRLTDRYVMFKCPNCGEEDITRCYDCRQTHIAYRCKKCNFEGP